jgi:hypothetical protein
VYNRFRDFVVAILVVPRLLGDEAFLGVFLPKYLIVACMHA